MVRTDLGQFVSTSGEFRNTALDTSLATLQLLQERGADLIICTATPLATGPKAPVLSSVAAALAERLGCAVNLKALPNAGSGLGTTPGEVVLLENLARHKGEATAEPAFIGKLAELADVFVNEAPLASAQDGPVLSALAGKLESYAGLQLHRELEILSEIQGRKYNQVLLLLGGKDIAARIALAKKVMSGINLKQLHIGGALSYTFLKSRAVPIGRSLFDASQQVDAFQVIEKSELSGVELVLPVDHQVGERFARDTKAKTVGRMGIADESTGLDIGPKSVNAIEKAIKRADAVLWLGPLGATELDRFAAGTRAVARALAKSKALSYVAGETLSEFLHQEGLRSKFSFVGDGSALAAAVLGGQIPKSIQGLVGRN